eukprot:3941961-Rhodomonas_salina.1
MGKNRIQTSLRITCDRVAGSQDVFHFALLERSHPLSAQTLSLLRCSLALCAPTGRGSAT